MKNKTTETKKLEILLAINNYALKIYQNSEKKSEFFYKLSYLNLSFIHENLKDLKIIDNFFKEINYLEDCKSFPNSIIFSIKSFHYHFRCLSFYIFIYSNLKNYSMAHSSIDFQETLVFNSKNSFDLKIQKTIFLIYRCYILFQESLENSSKFEKLNNLLEFFVNSLIEILEQYSSIPKQKQTLVEVYSSSIILSSFLKYWSHLFINYVSPRQSKKISINKDLINKFATLLNLNAELIELTLNLEPSISELVHFDFNSSLRGICYSQAAVCSILVENFEKASKLFEKSVFYLKLDKNEKGLENLSSELLYASSEVLKLSSRPNQELAIKWLEESMNISEEKKKNPMINKRLILLKSKIVRFKIF